MGLFSFVQSFQRSDQSLSQNNRFRNSKRIKFGGVVMLSLTGHLNALVGTYFLPFYRIKIPVFTGMTTFQNIILSKISKINSETVSLNLLV
ncbi:hypothetical protein J7E50_05870, partial [Pedobacter sp. ISL-68]|uniref:hypothetical protein n=1 Tax=Pedobacter sp. ISL-68 TaxID=2819165 RepID=UPI001BEC4C9D